MSLFHIANDGNFISILSVSSGVTVERNIEDLPLDAQLELCKLFSCTDLSKPRWTTTGVMLPHSSPIYLWYLFSKAEDLHQKQEEQDVVSAMEVLASALPCDY